jgi:hypothetical protein
MQVGGQEGRKHDSVLKKMSVCGRTEKKRSLPIYTAMVDRRGIVGGNDKTRVGT